MDVFFAVTDPEVLAEPAAGVCVGAIVPTAVEVGVFAAGLVPVGVGVLVGAIPVFVGVLVAVFVGGTNVPVGVLVEVFVGATPVFVGVLVEVLVGGTGVLVGVFAGGLETVTPSVIE